VGFFQVHRGIGESMRRPTRRGDGGDVAVGVVGVRNPPAVQRGKALPPKALPPLRHCAGGPSRSEIAASLFSSTDLDGIRNSNSNYYLFQKDTTHLHHV